MQDVRRGDSPTTQWRQRGGAIRRNRRVQRAGALPRIPIVVITVSSTMLAAVTAQCSALSRPAGARPARGNRRGGLVLCQANQTKEKSPLFGELGEAACQLGLRACARSPACILFRHAECSTMRALQDPLALPSARTSTWCAAAAAAAASARPAAVRLACARRAAGTLFCCLLACLAHAEASPQNAPGAMQEEPAAPAEKKAKKAKEGAAQVAGSLMDRAGVSLGPIGLTIGSELKNTSLDDEDGAGPSGSGSEGQPKSYASLTTEEWRELYEKDGVVDLWVQEEFNSGSRLVVSGGWARGRQRGPTRHPTWRQPMVPRFWARTVFPVLRLPGRAGAERAHREACSFWLCGLPAAGLLYSFRASV